MNRSACVDIRVKMAKILIRSYPRQDIDKEYRRMIPTMLSFRYVVLVCRRSLPYKDSG